MYTLFFSLLIFESCNTQQTANNPADKDVARSNDNAKAGVQLVSNGHSYSFDHKLALGALKYLSSDELEGRKPGTEGHDKAKAYIKKQFELLGVKPLGNNYEQAFRVLLRREKDSVEASNLVGYIKGSYHPEKYIVIGAHYDHVGIRNGKIYNGADDNASGVGGLLAMGSYFQKYPPEHSILFLAFDAEESGLQGSRFFVENPFVELEQIAMMINMDMISRNDKGELYACGTNHYPYLAKFLKDAEKKKEQVSLRLGHDKPSMGSDDWTNSSDQAPFHKANIPFIYFGVEDHPHYHKPTDDFETINVDFYLDCVDLILQSVKNFDQELGTVERRGKSEIEE